jgi:2-oxoglutarate ferredoxin oxidoreductase subunit delta
MDKVVIRKERCKSCGLCVSVCGKKILKLSETELNGAGYNPVECIDQEKCITCKMCAEICPDCVIEIYKEEK